jgi:NAT, N-acetyltransferase, of N-acetylglutamate synthase
VQISSFTSHLIPFLTTVTKLNLNPILVIKQEGSWNERLDAAYKLSNQLSNLGAKPLIFGDEAAESIRDVTLKGGVPVLPSLAVVGNTYIPINASDLLLRLAHSSTSSTDNYNRISKLIILNETGGVNSPTHQPLINLSERQEYDISKNTRQDIETITAVLGVLDADASAILASPLTLDLISNIINDRPLVSRSPNAVSGSSYTLSRSSVSETPNLPTLFRKGAKVHMHHSMKTVDRSKMEALLISSFSRQVVPAYWDRLESVSVSIMVAGDYLGAVIVTDEREFVAGSSTDSSLNFGSSSSSGSASSIPQSSNSSLPYLDKFAISPSCQGHSI